MVQDQGKIIEEELNEMRAKTNIKVGHIWAIQKNIVGRRKTNISCIEHPQTNKKSSGRE